MKSLNEAGGTETRENTGIECRNNVGNVTCLLGLERFDWVREREILEMCVRVTSPLQN